MLGPAHSTSPFYLLEDFDFNQDPRYTINQGGSDNNIGSGRGLWEERPYQPNCVVNNAQYRTYPNNGSGNVLPPIDAQFLDRKYYATTMPGLVSKPTMMVPSSATLLNLDQQPSPISPTDSNDSSQEYKGNVLSATNLPSSGAQRLMGVPANTLNNTNPTPATANDAALQFGSQLMSLVPGAGLNLTTGPGGQYISIPLNESYYHMRTTGQGIDESANQQYLVQTGTGPPVVEEAQRKREVRLLKNREAAKECRRKKKEYVKCLENRVAVLENQNKALIEELKSLKELYCQKQD